jgi:hypothetical protein
MNIKNTLKKLKGYIDPHINYRILVSVLFAGLAGQLLSLIGIEKVLIFIPLFFLFIDLGMTMFNRNFKKLIGKLVSVIIIILIARGLPFFNHNIMAISGILYYNLTNILNSVKGLISEIK